MSQSLALRTSIEPSIARDALDYAMASKSLNTHKTYNMAWANFKDFCAEFHYTALPASPDTVAAYVTFLAKHNRPSTIAVKLAAISFAHKAAEQSDPVQHVRVQTVMAGIRRTYGIKPNKKRALSKDVIRAALLAMPAPVTDADKLRHARDRAIILIAWVGMLRRSEVMNLTVKDIRTRESGLTLVIRRSKTDQESRGQEVQLPNCGGDINPVAALKAWLQLSGIKAGPIFRKIDYRGNIGKRALGDRAVAILAKKIARAAGLNDKFFAGHSFRRGGITSAYRAHEPEHKIMAQSRHKSTAVVREYNDAATDDAMEAARAALEK
jgi:integrase